MECISSWQVCAVFVGWESGAGVGVGMLRGAGDSFIWNKNVSWGLVSGLWFPVSGWLAYWFQQCIV